MKKILKQPFLWIAILSFVAAIAIAVFSGVTNSEPSVIGKLEKGINKRSTKRVISCLPPNLDEVGKSLVNVELEAAFSMMDKKDKLNILAGPVVTDADGKKTIEVFQIKKNGSEYTDVDSATWELVEVDGKLYLSGY